MKKLLALSASAGSGKTFNLVARYLSLLFMGAKPNEILAITFTNKASNEMSERIVKSLKNFDDENLINKISEFSGLSVVDIKSKQKEVYEKFISSDINIMTIDKFFNKIFRKFSFYEGVESDFEISSLDRNAIFKIFLESLSDREYLSFIEFAKYESKKSGDILDVLDNFYKKEKELPKIEITEVNLKEIEKEVMRYAKEIKDFILNNDYSPRAKNAVNFSNIDELLSKGKTWLLKNSLGEYRDFKKHFVDYIDNSFFSLKANLKIYFEYKEAFFLSKMLNIYEKYKLAKKTYQKDNSILDFQDIQNLTFDLMGQENIGEFLYFRLDSKITHMLIDEFQDTSVTQFKIFEPIISEIANSIEERTFFYVGDIKQAIYRFRGGQKELFNHVKNFFDVKVENLNINYRSKEEIVEFVNDTFDYVKPRQKAFNKGGYVEIKSGDILHKTLKETLKFMFDRGVDESSIAILVHENQTILEVERLIKEWFNKECVTTQKAKIIHQRFAKAVINLMTYFYYKTLNKEAKINKLNFFSLIGEEYQEEISITISKPYFMIKEIIEKYKLIDDSSIKLLEFSLKYESLLEFLKGVENYDEELPSKQLHGIKIMTIHKSKGLEFGNVIVCDRVRKSPPKDNIIFDYDGIEINDIKLRFALRDSFDEEYKKVIEKESFREYEDKKNLHYVAFTRSENSLFILQSGKTSNFDYLNLKDGFRGVFEVEERKEVKKVVHKLKSNLKNYGHQEVAKKEKEYKANDYEAIYLGNAIHSFFETDDYDYVLNRYGEMCDVKIAYEMYQKAKENPAYKSLLNGEIKRELPFKYRDELGFIDLAVFGEEIVIVDYKSTKPNDLRGYKSQVNRYKKAMSEIYDKKSKGYLYFIDSLEMMEV